MSAEEPWVSCFVRRWARSWGAPKLQSNSSRIVSANQMPQVRFAQADHFPHMGALPVTVTLPQASISTKRGTRFLLSTSPLSLSFLNHHGHH